MLVQNVMLNLFILVIITQFEKYYMSKDNPISKFKRNLDVFMVNGDLNIDVCLKVVNLTVVEWKLKLKVRKRPIMRKSSRSLA